MSIFNVFTLMGGIAMFLYGMDLMGKSLEQTAGSKLQGILSTMTASPVRALLLGMAVTAVIQSSGATTVTCRCRAEAARTVPAATAVYARNLNLHPNARRSMPSSSSLSISFYRLTAVQFTTYRPTTPRGEGAVGKIKAGSDT